MGAMRKRIYNPVTKSYYSIRRRSATKLEGENIMGNWKPAKIAFLGRKRNKDGTWRKKRSDAKPTSKYVKPSLSARVEHALAFIERFENSGEEEYISGLKELKRILKGETEG